MRWPIVMLLVGAGCASAATPPADTKPSPSASAPAPSAEPAAQSAPGPAPVEKADFAKTLAARFCAATAPCCDAVGTRHDADKCKADVAESWTEIVNASPAYDPAQGAACIERAAELAQGCNVGRGDLMDDPACGRAFDGDGELGASCKTDTDCAFVDDGKAFCWKGAMADEPGRCAVETKGKEGAACFSMDKKQPDQLRFSACSDGAELRCDSARAVCVPKAKVGEACQRSRDCTKPAVCSRAGQCVSLTGKPCSTSGECGSGERCKDGVCGPAGKLGEACGGMLDCGSGTHCAAATRTCSTFAGTFLCVKK